LSRPSGLERIETAIMGNGVSFDEICLENHYLHMKILQWFLHGLKEKEQGGELR
ncbi:MAG: hypothetical protein HQM07_09280, partial [Zetaproteobacteria bacterium]|nr:hypothetical protein [Zetaproteobacteria bacterium]